MLPGRLFWCIWGQRIVTVGIGKIPEQFDSSGGIPLSFRNFQRLLGELASVIVPSQVMSHVCFGWVRVRVEPDLVDLSRSGRRFRAS